MIELMERKCRFRLANTGDDRGRRERLSIIKTAGSATPVDRVVLRFPLNVREVVVYRSDNQFSNVKLVYM